jgi:geranylgeranyl transferase type-2 subunit alpha
MPAAPTLTRTQIASKNYTQDVFQLTSKLLRLNPEYYTIWNDRRLLLISGLLSRPSAGSWPSKASPSSSPTVTTTPSSAVLSTSLSATTPPNQKPPKAGKSGSIVEDGAAFAGVYGEGQAEDRAAAVLQDGQLLRSELVFTVPLLMEFPKCYWIWNYRLWVLQQAIKRLDIETARQIWEEELGLLSKMLTRDRRNFHAWNYRRHVVAQLESDALGGKSLVEPEFEYTTKMIRVDLSNFSAWYNRSKLIPRLLDERGADDMARKTFFDEGELSVLLRSCL